MTGCERCKHSRWEGYTTECCFLGEHIPSQQDLWGTNSLPVNFERKDNPLCSTDNSMAVNITTSSKAIFLRNRTPPFVYRLLFCIFRKKTFVAFEGSLGKVGCFTG